MSNKPFRPSKSGARRATALIIGSFASAGMTNAASAQEPAAPPDAPEAAEAPDRAEAPEEGTAREEPKAPGEAADPSLEARERALDEREKRLDELERRLSEVEAQLGEPEPAEVPDAPSDAPPETDEGPEAAAGVTAADLEAMLEEEPLASELVETEPLHIYGFMDAGVNKFIAGEESQLRSVFPTDATTFVLGNLNVFFDAEPWKEWRSLAEIRFTNLPHGYEYSLASPLGDPYDRADTEVEDFTTGSVRNSVVLGSIIIERAWSQWAPMDELQVRVGYFFTPYGIWNLDHGTPTLISLLLPGMQADQWIPNRTLGAQVLGTTYTEEWELGYHAYIGNGRTPSQVDFSDEKSFGGRVFAGTGLSTRVKFGASGYYGRWLDIRRRIVSFVPYLTETETVVDAREWSAGADLAIDSGPFRFRSEGLVRSIDFEPGKRNPEELQPDAYWWNAYALAAYRLPFAGLEPYAYFEYLHQPTLFGDTILIPSLGMNVHFNPRVSAKAQWAYATFHDFSLEEDRTPSDNNGHSLAARLVVAF